MSEKKEYIERGAALGKCTRVFRGSTMLVATRQDINAIPAADVEPVVRGEWKDGIDFDEQNVYMCSVCKEPYILESGTPKENKYNFCPNCGAHLMERSGSGE